MNVVLVGAAICAAILNSVVAVAIFLVIALVWELITVWSTGQV